MSAGVTIKQFTSKHHPSMKWVVYWPSPDPAKARKSRRFKSKAAADSFRFEKEIQVTNDGRKAAGLRESVIADAVWASEQLAPLGLSLRQVVIDYLSLHRRVAESIVIDVAVDEFLETKKAAGKSLRYQQDLSSRCNRFVQGYGKRTMAEIDVATVERWLESLKVEAVTKNNYRRVLSVFFAWGIKRGFCSVNPVLGTEKTKEIADRVEIFTPSELRLILNASPTALVPFLAIGAFAGLRTAEIERLKWKDLDFLNRRIDVSARISKSAANRYVPIPPALFAWLQPISKASGKICVPGMNKKLTAFRSALSKKVKGVRPAVAWKKNGMRHSFASYALAECDNAGQVALWLGHDSNKMIFKHYRERVTAEIAAEWFAVLPGEGRESKTEAVA